MVLMMMKQFRQALSLLLCFIFLTGCARPNADICEYRDIQITEDVYEVTSDDLDAAMGMYVYAAEDSIEDIHQLTDDIVERNFGVPSVLALKKLAIDEMVRHRIYEAVFDYILANSKVNLESLDTYQRYVEKVSQQNEALAELEKMSTSELIEQTYQMTEDSYWEYEHTRYTELYLMQEILVENQIFVSEYDLETEWDKLADEEGLTIEEAKGIFLEEDILYSVLSEKFYSFILSCYSDIIQSACEEMHSKFNL